MPFLKLLTMKPFKLCLVVGLTAIIKISTAQINTTSFNAKVDFSIGSGNPSANGLALKDFNGDGKVDITTVNQTANQLAILKNTGNNTINSSSFDAVITYPTASTPVDVFSDDIDGDGKFDLLVPNSGANSISIFRNTSTINVISFAARVDYTVGINSGQIVTADLNGDGIKEILNVNFGSNTFSVHRNNSTPGSILLQTPRTDFVASGTASSSREIAVDDIDGDGKQDVVVVQYNGQVSVFRNTSTLATISFAPSVNLTGYNLNAGVSIADVDLDGKKDIAISAYNNGYACLFKNNSTSGNISFSNLSNYPVGINPHGIQLKDLDNDNKPELVVCNRSSNTVSVFRNFSALGTFNANTVSNRINFTTNTTPISVDFADIDGDGKPEMITANNGAANISVLKNNVKPSNGLVAWYPFNGNAGDSSGFGNHGTTSNVSLTTDRVNSANSAYQFNGTNSKITVPTNISLRPNNRITVCAWIRSENKTASAWNMIFSHRYSDLGTPYDSYKIGTFPTAGYNNRWSFGIGVQSTLTQTELLSKPKVDNVWMHIAASYDGIAMKVFLNGLLDTSYNTVINTIAYGSIGLNIGNSIPNSSDAFLGKIDDLRIYDRALSTNEIKALAGIDTSTTVTYYSKATGNLNTLNTWGTNTDGSGTSPLTFDSNNVVYNVVNNTSPSLGGSFKIGGTGSVVVLGDGTNPFNLIIGANDTLSCDSTYIQNNITVTAIGALLTQKLNAHNSSTVQYTRSTTQPVAAGTYGNFIAMSSTKTLIGNTTVKNNLVMVASINCATYNLTLGTSAAAVGTLNRTQGTIIGSFTRWFAASTNTAAAGIFPIGGGNNYAPLTIEFTAAPTQGGAVTCQFITGAAGNNGLPQFDFANGAVYIDKPAPEGIWRLSGSGLTGGTFTTTVGVNNFAGVTNYLGLRIIRRNISNAWTLNGTAAVNTGTNTEANIIRTGMTNVYGEYGVGGDQSQNPLPVKLTNFSARLLSNDKAAIKWQTAQEINADYFIVQRSTDAHNWQSRTQVAAKGYSTILQQYNTTDELEQYVGTVYYRLVQVDRNDKKQTSHVVNVTQTKPQEFKLYPNPATAQVFIDGASGETTFYNLTGLPVLVTNKQGWISVMELKPGIYFVKNAQKVVKLVIE